MRGFLFELPPPLSKLLKPSRRAFCRGPGLCGFLTHQLLDRHYINDINLKAHQSEEIYRVFAVGLFIAATLERESVAVVVSAIRSGAGLNLDAVDFLARIDQAVIGGVVAKRNGNIEALA